MAFKSKIKDPIDESFKQYRHLVEFSPVAIGAQSNDKIVFINAAGANLLGFEDPSQLINKSLADFLHPDYRENLRERFRSIEENSTKFTPFEVKLERTDGKIIDLEISAVNFSYLDKPAVQFCFYDIGKRKKAEEEIKKAKDELELRVEERTKEMRDINEKLKAEITERKSAVEALQKNETRYMNLTQEFNALLDGIPDNLILLSPDLKILWANKAAAATFGKEVSELTDQYCYSLCCNIFSPCENCPTQKSFPSGIEETAEISTRDGKIWDIRAFPIKDDSGKVKSVIELARDITEKVNLQAGATRTRHLASLGELAAGVAHEINNPINNIINYAQILIDEFEKEKRDDEITRRIIKDGDRIATIVRSLLSFARIRKEEKTYVYIHEIFSDTLSLTSAQIRKDGIHLKASIPSEPMKVPVHAQQIQQVFLNLLSNARFALNQKYPGTHENKILDIKCEKIAINNSPHIRIIFTDNGTGIPSAIMDKVINPFFSTKPSRIGTGLGLSISHGIISEHGGKLSIDSSEGEYTRTTIDLPIEMDSET